MSASEINQVAALNLKDAFKGLGNQGKAAPALVRPPDQVVGQGIDPPPGHPVTSKRVTYTGGGASMALNSYNFPRLLGPSLTAPTLGGGVGAPRNPLAVETGRGSQLYTKGIPNNGMPQPYTAGLSQLPMGDYAGTYMDPATGVVYDHYTDPMPEPVIMRDAPVIELGKANRMLEMLTGVSAIRRPQPTEHLNDLGDMYVGYQEPASFIADRARQRDAEQARAAVMLTNNENLEGYNDTHWDGYIGDVNAMRWMPDTQTLMENSQTATNLMEVGPFQQVGAVFPYLAPSNRLDSLLAPVYNVLTEAKPSAPLVFKMDGLNVQSHMPAGSDQAHVYMEALKSGSIPTEYTQYAGAPHHMPIISSSTANQEAYNGLVAQPTYANQYFDGQAYIQGVAAGLARTDTLYTGHGVNTHVPYNATPMQNAVADSVHIRDAALNTNMNTQAQSAYSNGALLTTAIDSNQRSTGFVSAPQTVHTVDVYPNWEQMPMVSTGNPKDERYVTSQSVPVLPENAGNMFSQMAQTSDGSVIRTDNVTAGVVATNLQADYGLGTMQQLQPSSTRPQSDVQISSFQPVFQAGQWQNGNQPLSQTNEGAALLYGEYVSAQPTEFVPTAYTQFQNGGGMGFGASTAPARRAEYVGMVSTAAPSTEYTPTGMMSAASSSYKLDGQTVSQPQYLSNYEQDGQAFVAINSADRGKDASYVSRGPNVQVSYQGGQGSSSSDGLARRQEVAGAATVQHYDNMDFADRAATNSDSLNRRYEMVGAANTSTNRTLDAAGSGATFGSIRVIAPDSGFDPLVSTVQDDRLWVEQAHKEAHAWSHPVVFGQGAEFRHEVKAPARDRTGFVVQNPDLLRAVTHPARGLIDGAAKQQMARSYYANKYKPAIMESTGVCYSSDLGE
jgi:hypothetical protein